MKMKLKKNTDHADEEDMRLFVRYNMNNIYLTANTTTEDFSDNLRFGAGYSFAAFGNLYMNQITPWICQLMMVMKEMELSS